MTMNERWFLAATLLVASCDVVDATQVLVHFDASADLAARAALGATMTVTVFDVDGAPVEPPAVREVGSGPDQVSFPTTVPVEPLGGDATRRFRIVGVLRDADGRMIARGETTEAFEAGEQREVDVDLREDCVLPLPALPPLPEGGRRFYVGPSGDDMLDGLTPTTAWGTFAFALPQLMPGDTLILRDGTYRELLVVQTSGEPDAPITIVAENDGGATIDGQSRDTPCRIGFLPVPERVAHIELRGVACINARPGGYGALHIERADHVVVRRVSAQADKMPDVTDSVTPVNLVDVTATLIEDVSAWGTATNLFRVARASGVTFRRCYARSTLTESIYANGFFIAEDVQDSLLENCVASAASVRSLAGGFTVQVAETLRASNDNRLIGNVSHRAGTSGYVISASTAAMRGTRVEQSVSIGAQTAFFHRGDSDLTIDRNTWVGRGLEGDIGYTVNPGDPGGMPRDTGYLLAGRIAGTVIVDVDFGLRRTSVPEVGTITHAYNDFFRVTTTHDSGFMQDPTELEVDPGYDVARYGDGAYLMPAPALMGLGEGGGDIGADVRYRLEDGVLTDVPLWPWPMEDRIDREQGVSVTYDSADGLFETLCDVY